MTESTWRILASLLLAHGVHYYQYQAQYYYIKPLDVATRDTVASHAESAWSMLLLLLAYGVQGSGVPGGFPYWSANTVASIKDLQGIRSTEVDQFNPIATER